ncbi:hypothetical protein O3P69_009223 [Scylla paramamosain]|uniref:Uncharacterized protein n=1 Tax=Scylla paramamosain TaxID=85552 RepID=A0AAW0TC89_SCYPA
MLRYKDNELSHVPSRKSSEKYKENEASRVTKNTSPDKANTHNASPRKQHCSTSPNHSTPQKTMHKLATPEGSPVLGKGGRKRYPQSTTGDTGHKRVSAAAPQDSTPVRRLTLGDTLVTPSGKEFKNISSFSPALNVSDDLTSPSLLQPLGGLYCPSEDTTQQTAGRGTGRTGTGGHGLGKLHVSPPDPHRKAGYRQTTVARLKRVFLDDEEAFRLAVKESLQLKALADMGRQLDQEEEEEESVAGEEEKESVRVREGDKAIPSQQDILEPSPSLIRSQVPAESPVKLPNLRPAHTSPGPALTSPRAPSVTPRKLRHSPAEGGGGQVCPSGGGGEEKGGQETAGGMVV